MDREAFEKWWNSGDDIANSGPWEHDSPIQFAWEAWQAAKACMMEGKAIVPVEPTHAMCLAGNSLLPSTHNADEVWQAMLAAAQECEQ